MKTCKGCALTLPLEAFHKTSAPRVPDGRFGKCKRCINEATRERYYKFYGIEPRRILVAQLSVSEADAVPCTKCERVLTAGSFHRNPNRPSKLNLWCCDCARASARANYRAKTMAAPRLTSREGNDKWRQLCDAR